MARSYYSIALDHSAEEVWATIREFDHYAWAGVPSKTTIEAGKAGDQERRLSWQSLPLNRRGAPPSYDQAPRAR